jgi:hypothetical protein
MELSTSPKVGADILDTARCHQEGRAPADGANAPTHNFTEGWFLKRLETLKIQLMVILERSE